MHRRSVLAALLLSIASLAGAQGSYPTKPITMVVPFPPGGLADTVGRPIAEAMSRDLGQTVVVENKGGAGGGIGMAHAAKAQPDGYTVLFSNDNIMLRQGRGMGLALMDALPPLKKAFARKMMFGAQAW